MENLRLDRVKEYLELSLSEEKDLQEFIFLASEICQTPIASITLVDDKMQYPVLGIGSVVESSCEVAFCNHTIRQNDVLYVPDAKTDQRFSNNPLVTGSPHIRFYAGAPLVTSDGLTIGSLCVIDQKPKTLSESQVKGLQILSKQVMHRLELNLNFQKLKASVDEATRNKELLEHAEMIKAAFFEGSNDYFLLLNPSLEIVAFNSPTQKFFEQRKQGSDFKAGKAFLEYVHPSYVDNLAEIFTNCSNGTTDSQELRVNADVENKIWIRFTVTPVYNSRKELIGIAGIAYNIDQEKTMDEKLKLQASVLTRIAQVHSHEIRHPLTNILGIIDIIKQEGFVMTKEYLEYFEKASKELDNVIKKVVMESHCAA